MVRKFATFTYLLLFSLNSFAELEAPMKFTGQNAETIKLEKTIKVSRPFPREVPSTCTRQVPYQTNVCRDVTRYRQECQWVGAEQECHTEYDRQCRSVTRYREECTRGPSRQECSTTPTRQVCTDRPSRRVCTPIPTRQECSTSPTRQVCTDRPSRQECTTTPTREVCTERPTREVCTTRPDGQQHCTTVGGGQSCRTVGGDQSCRTVGGGQDCRTVGGEYSCRTVGGGETCADVGGGQDCRTVGGETQCRTVEGDPICRSVPYSDQECENVPRQACRTIPAHNECSQVPYTENVCGNETAYRTETYACTETVYDEKEVEKKVSGLITVTLKTNGIVEEFGAVVGVVPDAKGKTFAPVIRLTSEPKTLVIVKSKAAKIKAEGEKEIKVEGEVVVELVEPTATEQIAFPEVEAASIVKKTSILSVTFAKPLPVENGQLRKGELDFSMTFKGKEIAVLKDSFPGQKVEVKKIEQKDTMILNLKDLVTGPMSGGIFSSAKPMMKLLLKLPSKLQGDILNAKKPQSEKLYENVKVQKK